jgi:hypothetical protein
MSVTTRDDKCTACLAVASLNVKIVIHRAAPSASRLAAWVDCVGPAVNVEHRLLKNAVRDRIGSRPYLLLTEAAAEKLGLAERGLVHHEQYPDVGSVDVRIVDLAEAAGVVMTTWTGPPPDSEGWPTVSPFLPDVSVTTD